MPGRWFESLGTQRAWPHETVEQTALGRRLAMPVGRTLGGSGSINAMIWLLGDPRDYEVWTKFGGVDWGYDTCRQAFLALEDVHTSSRASRGEGGAFPITRPNDAHEMTERYLTACSELGLPTVELNGGGSLDGTGRLDHNILDGRRMGPAQVLLGPALARPNLTVLTSAMARKINVRGSRARSVEVTLESQLRKFEVEEELVLAAGALSSPKLLQVSGVGPSEVLEQAGVETIVDLEGVGRNLHDHHLSAVVYETKQPLQAALSTGYGTEIFGRTTPTTTSPNLHLLTSNSIDGFEGRPAESGLSVLCGLGKPKSRGTLSIRTARIEDDADIDPAYLASEADREDAVAALELTLDLFSTPTMRSITGKRLVPGNLESSAEKLAYVRENLASYFHSVGTCRFGSDDLAVLSPDLRVRGVDALRVADASAIPEIPCVNTHAPTLVVAQRAAEMILEKA